MLYIRFLCVWVLVTLLLASGVELVFAKHNEETRGGTRFNTFSGRLERSADTPSETEEYVEEEESTEEKETSHRERDNARKLDDEREEKLKVPVFGVRADQLYDSWGDPRSGGRKHEGIDILAPKGTFIVSPTEAVVSRIGFGVNGGKYVFTINPGGERFYYAHLDRYAEGLREGDRLEPGDLIGYIGNTGNAEQGPDHLHFGIYNRGAENPFPRMTENFSTRENIAILEDYANRYDNAVHRLQFIQYAVRAYSDLFVRAQLEGVSLSNSFAHVAGSRVARVQPSSAIVTNSSATSLTRTISSAFPQRDLELGATGVEVVQLQQFLISRAAGARAAYLARSGATGYFGPVTQSALIEYQTAVGIRPAAGYYGAITRAHIARTN